MGRLINEPKKASHELNTPWDAVKAHLPELSPASSVGAVWPSYALSRNHVSRVARPSAHISSRLLESDALDRINEI